MSEEPGEDEEHTCPICQEVILEATSDSEGHEAIFCDGGSCRVWYHRWCAGVTKKRYESLAGSEAPFLCPSCTMEQQSSAIAALQEAVKSLTTQLAESQLQHVCSEEQPSPMPPQKWSLVVRNGKGGNKDKGKCKVKGGGDAGEVVPGKEKKPTRSVGTRNARSRQRVQVKGARRVWGTVKATTTTVVKATLKRFSTTGEGVLVKRKYKTAGDGSKRVIRWWFVVRGEEAVLQRLQDEWPRIAVHTAWKLEPLYSYDTINSVTPSLSSVQPANPQLSNKMSHSFAQPLVEHVVSPAQQPSALIQQQETSAAPHSSVQSPVEPVVSPAQQPAQQPSAFVQQQQQLSVASQPVPDLSTQSSHVQHNPVATLPSFTPEPVASSGVAEMSEKVMLSNHQDVSDTRPSSAPPSSTDEHFLPILEIQKDPA